MGVRRLGAVAVLAVLLAACDVGKAHEATRVGDTSAELHADIISDDAGTLTWWFEYGPTAAMGSTTPEGTATFEAPDSAPQPVSATVTGLAEATTYHYRACVRNARGGGLCGRTLTTTTTSGRDSVNGSWFYFDPSLRFYLGASADVSAEADGTGLEGSASVSPGSLRPYLADEGPATCLRVAGSRAVVGFIGDLSAYGEPQTYWLLYIDDGPTGDRFWSVQVDTEVTACPDPTVVPSGAFEWPVPVDSFVVHDHP
jgi:hypothetical protein